MSDLEEPKPGISRRTVAKAAAWSVPAIALAVSTPAYAASPGFITRHRRRLQAAGKGDRRVQGLRVRRHHLQRRRTPTSPFRSPTSPSTGRILEPSLLCDLETCTELGATFVVAAGTQRPPRGDHHPGCRQQRERHADHQLHGGRRPRSGDRGGGRRSPDCRWWRLHARSLLPRRSASQSALPSTRQRQRSGRPSGLPASAVSAARRRSRVRDRLAGPSVASATRQWLTLLECGRRRGIRDRRPPRHHPRRPLLAPHRLGDPDRRRRTRHCGRP